MGLYPGFQSFRIQPFRRLLQGICAKPKRTFFVIMQYILHIYTMCLDQNKIKSKTTTNFSISRFQTTLPTRTAKPRTEMIFSILLFLAVWLGTAATDPLPQRPDNGSYIRYVCSPIVENATVVPPCISIENIEIGCQPNGTTPLDYLAHSECMCSPPSSFFDDWRACEKCQFVHGARTEKDIAKYASIMTTASSSLCAGTPTAQWRDIFSSVKYKVPDPTTGSSVSSDQFISQSAVSLYYTPSGSQGPGAITG